MQHFGFAPSLLQMLRQLPAMLVCLAMLAGCEAVSLFDDAKGIEQAISALRERLGRRVFVLNVLIAPDQITIRVQDPQNRSRVDEWRLERMRVAWLNWERTSGPLPYPLTLINPDLEANLFELSEVDFVASMALARAAIGAGAIAADGAKVTRMEIAREVFVIPRPSSGEIRWTVDVSNGRESAQVYANASGMIVGMNLDGTDRAKTFNIFQDLKLLADAARMFRAVVGPDLILYRINIGPRAAAFETNIPDVSFPIPVAGSLGARKVYTWDINGLQRALGTLNVDAALPTASYAQFGVDEIDWTVLPKILAVMKEQLAMPEGRMTAIELSKPMTRVGPLGILWKVEVTDQNNEKGFLLADTTGAVKEVIPPESRRKRSDWYDPQTILDTRARMGTNKANPSGPKRSQLGGMQ